MNRRDKIFYFLQLIATFGYSLAHLDMVRYFCPKRRFASYDEFEKAFKKVYWHVDRNFPESLFGPEYAEDRISQFHGHVIQINGIGFILSPYGFYKANKLRKRTIKQLKQYQNP